MGIGSTLQKSIERAIESADISMVVKNTIFIAASLLLMCGGFVLASNGDAAGAAATYVAGVFCLVFAALPQFKKFSGLGFSGETWERKLQEADDLIAHLKSLAVVVSHPMLMLIPRMGRWDSSLSRLDQYELVKRIEQELALLKVPAADIDKAKSDIHYYIIHDLAAPIIDGACKEAGKMVEQLNSVHQSFPQPISNHSEYNEAIEAWRGAIADEALIHGVRNVSPPEAIPQALRKAINESPLLTEAQRAHIFDRYKEEIADLEHYSLNHSFRRLSEWLAGDLAHRAGPSTF